MQTFRHTSDELFHFAAKSKEYLENTRYEIKSFSVFNLGAYTLHSKIVHQTLEIQACKFKNLRYIRNKSF